MIISKIVLEQELSKIKKCNLCSNQTTRKDAKEYCINMLNIFKECELSSKDASPIFAKHIKNSMPNRNKIARKFNTKPNAKVLELAHSGDLEFGVATLVNLSSGNAMVYDYLKDRYQHLIEQWARKCAKLSQEENLDEEYLF